jgi:hypothetical protein
MTVYGICFKHLKRMTSTSRGFTLPPYGCAFHDEERLMYKIFSLVTQIMLLTMQNLNVALSMSAFERF